MAIWPYIAVGGGLIGGALLFRKAKESAPAPSSSSNPCDRLPAGQARDLCNTLRAGLPVLGAVVNAVEDATQSRQAANVEKNGPIVESLDRTVWDHVSLQVGASGDGQGGPRLLRPLIHGGIRHQNGCVPIPGHPDWAKCAPGTRHIVSNGNLDDATHFARDCYWALSGALDNGFLPSGLFSGGRPKDLFTFKWPANKPAPAQAPAGAGELWVVRGKFIRCPLGTTVTVNERDHRESSSPAPVCAPPSTVGATPPPITPTIPTGTGTRTGTGVTVDRRDPNR